MHAGLCAKCQLLSDFTYAGMSCQILVKLLSIKFHGNPAVVLELLYYTGKYGEANRSSYARFHCEHIKIRETFPYGSSEWASEKFGVPISKPIYGYNLCNCNIVGKQFKWLIYCMS
jgi:hypothetical protein